MPPLALTDVLAELPDPRSPHGRIHPLPAVLELVVLNLLMGTKSLSASARLGRRLDGPPLAHALGLLARPPLEEANGPGSTVRRFLRHKPGRQHQLPGVPMPPGN
ncbi:MAG TPA: hypothetical protein VEL76_10585 [Gemmataceae bacterium]|nr:hypothetical protein [Gemmataceae bacterium]